MIDKIKASRLVFVRVTTRGELDVFIEKNLKGYKEKVLMVAELKPAHTKADVKNLKYSAICDNKLVFLYSDKKPAADLVEVFDHVFDVKLEH